MKQRNRYFDVLRGVAILMVIAIHTYKSSIEGWINLANLGVRQILNCAVPLFFAMSGFFVYRKVLDSKQAVLKFWEHQIPKIYIPTLIWSLPLFMLALIKGKNPITNTLNLLICGFSVYYFIAVTIQYYLLLPALQRLKAAKQGGVILSVIINLVSIAVVTYFNIILDADLPLIIYAGCGLLWLMFYVVGCGLSETSRMYSLRNVVALLLIGFILSYLESFYLMSNYRLGFGIKPSSFVFSLGAVLFLMSAKVEDFIAKRENGVFRLFEYLGSVSFIVYLIHCYVISWVLPHSGIINDYWLTRWLLVLFSALLGVHLMKRLVPTELKYYFGIYD